MRILYLHEPMDVFLGVDAMKPILIMKTGKTLEVLRASGSDFEDWVIQGLGVTDAVTIAVDLGEPLPALTEIRGIVITGSPAMLTDAAPWNDVAADYLRDAVTADLPVLGICYGHQLLSWAFGGCVDYHPLGREIGTVQVTITERDDDALLADLPLRFFAHTTHSQSVTVLPDHAVLLASSVHDRNQCFRIGRQAWGVQFHPEFDAAVMRTYITERGADLSAEGLSVDDLLAQVRETPAAASVLRKFVRITERQA